jgi:hypothetical protein
MVFCALYLGAQRAQISSAHPKILRSGQDPSRSQSGSGGHGHRTRGAHIGNPADRAPALLGAPADPFLNTTPMAASTIMVGASTLAAVSTPASTTRSAASRAAAPTLAPVAATASAMASALASAFASRFAVAPATAAFRLGALARGSTPTPLFALGHFLGRFFVGRGLGVWRAGTVSAFGP